MTAKGTEPLRIFGHSGVNAHWLVRSRKYDVMDYTFTVGADPTFGSDPLVCCWPGVIFVDAETYGRVGWAECLVAAMRGGR